MARVVKSAQKKNVAATTKNRRRSTRIAKINPVNGFQAKPTVTKAAAVAKPGIKKKTAAGKSKVAAVAAKTATKSGKPVKTATVKAKKEPKTKNEKLEPRPNIPSLKENPFFVSKTGAEFPSGTDMLYSVRFAHRLVELKDMKSLKKLIHNPRLFPQGGVQYGYSVYDKKNLTARAVALGDDKVLDEVKKIISTNKATNRESLHENCILQKMATGEQNIHMLGHRTNKIEMTRGSRQGNNALIVHDDQESNDDDFEVIQRFGDDLDIITYQKYTSNIHIAPVWAAIRAGNRKLAAQLINASCRYLFNDLHMGTLQKDDEPLKKFMPISTTKKAQMHKRITPIHTAAINPNARYLKQIIAVDPAFNLPDQDNWCAIHYAAVCTGPEPLKYLIQRGAPVTMMNKHKETPLHCACRAGRLENVKVLVNAVRSSKQTDEDMEFDEAGSDYDPKVSGPRRKRRAPKAQVKRLPECELSTYINAKDIKTFTPLDVAIKYGHMDIVEYLLKEKDVKIELPLSATQDKLTPLMIAAQKGDLDMVKLLIDSGNAFIDAQDKFKRTPLIHSVLGGHDHVTAEFLRRGAAVALKPDSSGNSAAHYAAAYGWLEALKLLEKAEPECLVSKNSWQLTPLMCAFLKNHAEIVSWFLDEKHAAKIEVNDQDNDGNTILHLVLKYEGDLGEDRSFIDKMEFLKETGAKGDVKNGTGLTPLHYFAEKPFVPRPDFKDPNTGVVTEYIKLPEYWSMLEYLSNQLDPATINLEDDEGNTALERALKTGNFLLVNKLFRVDQQTVIERWEKTAQSTERVHTVFHDVVDALFSLVKQVKGNDVSSLKTQKFVDFISTLVDLMSLRKVTGSDQSKSVAWALLSKYDTAGETPLIKLVRNLRSFSIPTDTVAKNSAYVDFYNDILIVIKRWVQVDKQFINWRKLECQVSDTQQMNGFQSAQRKRPELFGRRHQMNHVNSQNNPIDCYKPSAFEYAINSAKGAQKTTVSFLGKDKSIDLGFLPFLVCLMDKELFESAMMHQDERFGFKGLSPLLYCIQNKCVNAVCYLLTKCDEWGLTEKVCSLKLEKISKDGGISYETVNKTAFLMAIEQKEVEIAEFLVKKTKLAREVDGQGKNAFHYLAGMIDDVVDFFEILNSNGLQYTLDQDGRHPLHYAVAALLTSKGTDISTDNLEFILSADPKSVEVVDKDGRLAVVYAFIPFEEKWKTKDSAASTAAPECPFGTTSSFNQYPFIGAKSANHVAAFGLGTPISNGTPAAVASVNLVEREFDPTKVSKSDPISVTSLLMKLMSPKALQKTDKYGNSVVHYAAMAGANICVMTMLNKFKNLNDKNSIGNSPLALAVNNQHEGVTMTLIQAGASVTDKFYGLKAKPLDAAAEKWKHWSVRSKAPKQKEATILSLIVRNGWQGIIYIVLDRLNDRSDQVLIELLSAAIEHSQFYLAQTLLKKLRKIKDIGPRATGLFVSFKTFTTSNEAQKKLFESLFEAGFAWTAADGTSAVAEKYGSKGNTYGLLFLRDMDQKYNGCRNWAKMLKSSSADRILHGLICRWSGGHTLSVIAFYMSLIKEFSSKYPNFGSQLMDFDAPAYLGMEKYAPKKPDAAVERTTALIHAIDSKKYGLLQFLLDKDLGDVNVVDESGRTPMMHALACNDVGMVQQLLGMRDSEVDKEVNQGINGQNLVLADYDEDYVSEAEDEEEVDLDEEDDSCQDDSQAASEVDGDDEQDVSEDEDEDEESEPVVAKKIRLDMKLVKKRRAHPPKPDPKQKAKNKVRQLSFLKSKVDFEAVDRQGNNALHYLVSPNGFENVDLLKNLIRNKPELSKLLVKENNDKESPLALAAKAKQKKLFKQMAAHVPKDKVTPKLLKAVELESELEAVQELAFAHDVDAESSKFVEAQVQLHKVVESDEERRKRERRPHFRASNAETSEIVEEEDTKKLYKVLLQKTDVQYGLFGFHNYYRLQLMQGKRSTLFVLYTNWGRIGDDVGQCQHTPFNDREVAVKEFKSIFRQKTGNDFDGEFEEKPGKYKLVTVEEDPVPLAELDIELKAATDAPLASSAGAVVSYQLIKDVSNVSDLKAKWKHISQSLLNNLPFGRVNEEQLSRASEILKKCRKLEAGKKKQNLQPAELLTIMDEQCKLTNEFYMNVALGRFAFGKLRILSDEGSIKSMESSLEQIWDFEVAAKLVTAAAGQKLMDPYSYIEKALETKLTLLDSESLEVQRILEYIHNSSASTKVTGVFSVLSKANTENFEQSGIKLPNQKYLWHGSKAENLLSILKVGLLASPPHARFTGDLYGEGIYFSDAFEKSKGYCVASAGGYCYALLCQVALGDMYAADNVNVTIPMPGMKKADTLRANGNLVPNEALDITSKGVRLALGKMKRASAQSYYQQYMEYIVKDCRNVNIRYLIQFKM